MGVVKVGSKQNTGLNNPWTFYTGWLWAKWWTVSRHNPANATQSVSFETKKKRITMRNWNWNWIGTNVANPSSSRKVSLRKSNISPSKLEQNSFIQFRLWRSVSWWAPSILLWNSSSFKGMRSYLISHEFYY